MPGEKGTIRIEGAVMIVQGELDWSMTARFDEACQELLKVKDSARTVDLSGVHMITSPFLGILSQTAVHCLGRNEPLKVRVPAKLLSLFHTLNFEKFARIEVS